LCVGDDDGLARLQHAHHRVGGPQVDSYGLRHVRVVLPFVSSADASVALLADADVTADTCRLPVLAELLCTSVANLSPIMSRFLILAATTLYTLLTWWTT